MLTSNYKNYQLLYWYLSNIITIVINNHSPSLTTITTTFSPFIVMLLSDDICYQLILHEVKLRRQRIGVRKKKKKKREGQKNSEILG